MKDATLKQEVELTPGLAAELTVLTVATDGLPCLRALPVLPVPLSIGQ
jgi:hypothetical protein